MSVETTETTEENPPSETPAEENTAAGESRKVQLSSIVSTLLVLTVVAALAGLTWGWWSASSKLSQRQAADADAAHAKTVATDYAVGASTIDYRDLNPWISRLKTNTSPQLSAKFDATAPKLTEVLVPLQWTSTAEPIAAQTTSQAEGIFQVNVFLNVTAQNVQNEDSPHTTVTYTVAVSKNDDWKVIDVGGLDGALPSK